jgi:hypothetical protein
MVVNMPSSLPNKLPADAIIEDGGTVRWILLFSIISITGGLVAWISFFYHGTITFVFEVALVVCLISMLVAFFSLFWEIQKANKSVGARNQYTEVSERCQDAHDPDNRTQRGQNLCTFRRAFESS